MRNKKNMVLFCIIIVGLIFIISGITYMKSYQKEEKDNKSGIEKLKNNIYRKEKMLIYVREDNNDLCKETDGMIKYYEDAFGLEFYYSSEEGLSNSDLVGYFELEEQAIEYPSVVYIQDGMFKGVANKILSEDYFRDYLMEYGFIDKSYYESDYRINYEEFKENFSSSEKQILFFYDYGSNVYSLGETGEKKEFKNKDDIRRELFKLSKDNNFKYRVVFYNSEGSDKIYNEIITNIGKKEIAGPFIAITENNKVVDYLALKKVSSVSKFLEKNGIISGN